MVESKFDKLANKIAKEYRKDGDSAEKAKEIGEATAAKIGFAKYGKRGMERKARAGRDAESFSAECVCGITCVCDCGCAESGVCDCGPSCPCPCGCGVEIETHDTESFEAPPSSRESKVARAMKTRSSGKSRGKKKGPFVFPARKAYPIGDMSHAKRALIFSTWPDNTQDAEKVRDAVFKRYPKLRDWFLDGKYAKHAESFSAEDDDPADLYSQWDRVVREDLTLEESGISYEVIDSVGEGADVVVQNGVLLIPRHLYEEVAESFSAELKKDSFEAEVCPCGCAMKGCVCSSSCKGECLGAESFGAEEGGAAHLVCTAKDKDGEQCWRSIDLDSKGWLLYSCGPNSKVYCPQHGSEAYPDYYPDEDDDDYWAESFDAEKIKGQTQSNIYAKFFVGHVSNDELRGNGKFKTYDSAVKKAKEVAKKEGNSRVVSPMGAALWTSNDKGLFQAGHLTKEAKRFYNSEEEMAVGYLSAESALYEAPMSVYDEYCIRQGPFCVMDRMPGKTLCVKCDEEFGEMFPHEAEYTALGVPTRRISASEIMSPTMKVLRNMFLIGGALFLITAVSASPPKDELLPTGNIEDVKMED